MIARESKVLQLLISRQFQLKIHISTFNHNNRVLREVISSMLLPSNRLINSILNTIIKHRKISSSVGMRNSNKRIKLRLDRSLRKKLNLENY